MKTVERNPQFVDRCMRKIRTLTTRGENWGGVAGWNSGTVEALAELDHMLVTFGDSSLWHPDDTAELVAYMKARVAYMEEWMTHRQGFGSPVRCNEYRQSEKLASIPWQQRIVRGL